MKRSSWSCHNRVHRFHAYAARCANVGAVEKQNMEGSWAEERQKEEPAGSSRWVSVARKTKTEVLISTMRFARSFLFTEAPRAQRSNSRCRSRLRVLVEWELECSQQSFWNYSWIFQLMFLFIGVKRLFSAQETGFLSCCAWRRSSSAWLVRTPDISLRQKTI